MLIAYLINNYWFDCFVLIHAADYSEARCQSGAQLDLPIGGQRIGL